MNNALGSKLATTVIALGLVAPGAVAWAPAAQAQDAAQEATKDRPASEGGSVADTLRQRRGERDRRRAGGEQEQAAAAAAAPRYPGVTRKDPDAKASAKNSPKLKKMFDAYEKNDSVTTLAVADEVLADSSANAYEHAVSARLAGASLLNTEPARAATYLKRAVDYNGLNNNEHFEALLLQGQLQIQQQQYTEGLATVDRFLAETKSQDAEHLAVKGNALYRLKRYPEAAEVLKQAIAASPQPKADWQQLLMGAYAEMGQPAEAAKLAEQLGAGAPDDKQAQLNLAATYMQSGQEDKAIVVLEKLRSSGQLTDERDYTNLYVLYNNADGKEKDVIAVINEGLQKGILKPGHQTYGALAQAYFFTDQTGPAIEAYQKAAPLAPDGEAYLNLARVLHNEGRAAESRAAAEQALAKGVKKPEDARKLMGGK